MPGLFTRILQPVERLGAQRYLRLMLLAFAASVILTRLFLTLTGYPQVGNGTLHIAHLLWGGLLLFVAALLPLIFSNRWVYPASGILSGVGVGLFIDEVGKFITRNNDYFYPAAAPIIYAFFLLTVLLYLRVRSRPPQDPRSELYRAFDDMAEVLDHDLEPHEFADLCARLKGVASQTTHPDYARLGQVLLEFLNSDAAALAHPVRGRVAILAARTEEAEAGFFTRPRWRALLAAGLVLIGLFSIGDVAVLAGPSSLAISRAARLAVRLSASSAAPPAAIAEAQGTASPGATAPASLAGRGSNGPAAPQATYRASVAFWLRVALQGLVGLLLLLAALLLLARHDLRGVGLGIFSLLLALITVNLLVFYFDQFAAVAGAVLQFGLYQGLVRYRRRYLAPEVAAAMALRSR
jgi:hypothetical protein